MSEFHEDTRSDFTAPIPEFVGPYRIVERIASGESTLVYRAADAGERQVCVQTLRAPFADDSQAISRFLAGAGRAELLQHPNIVRTLRCGTEGGHVYAVTEFIEGEDLARLTARGGARPAHQVLMWLRRAADAFAFAFDKGVAHGDIRPSRIMRGGDGSLRVIGFGTSVGWTTQAGVFVTGAPAYLAPELARGQRVDARSEIYAFACMACELLTGRPPFGSGAPNALLACHLHELFPRVSKSAGPAVALFDDVLREWAAKNPHARPQTWREVIDRLAVMVPPVPLDDDAPELVIVHGRDAGKSCVIAYGDLILGREGDCFVVDDAAASRRHARVRRTASGIHLLDLESRNGVEVNHQRTHACKLTVGDVITIGETVLELRPRDRSTAAAGRVIPTSPVRGAYGARELVHAPDAQLLLNRPPPMDSDDLLFQRNTLTAFAQLLAQDTRAVFAMRSQIADIAASNLGAEAGILVRVADGEPVLDGEDDDALLSTILPALRRALPGAISLSTSVRVGKDRMVYLLAAPIRTGRVVSGYLAVVQRGLAFAEGQLYALESACALLSLRSDHVRA